ncbi:MULTISPECIES: CaiB/BaiF CoA transferase family protein [Aneurinibacillus]|jgi:crotonobetainyl-CoA:carnitine CoA-transferase CaiB-like acyl-CoA transferase|uniref:CoA transferase n=1 Tax=Aneurinibacillus danicus TaxID=267746 RepID=A0A511V900_9BACL|nr:MULTISPECIES: CaiB/BaiF CoA-transferase family protein [Aneurinibacillus]GEN35434.1 CoA transferase [Aneurinibacillus danicus]
MMTMDKEALIGLRILDLTRLLPGPYCTLLLGDLGAEIIKVEEKGRGDYTRDMLRGIYYAVNRNKKSISVDLKLEEGRQIVLDLAKQCDVLVEGFRPGVVNRLGIDYETIKAVNPKIIYCSISGYGQDGPYKLEPGHDLNYLSVAGAMSIPGQMGYPPMRSGLPVADLSSSMFAAVSILAAVVYQRSTGKGQYIDVSMTDSVFSWASTRFGDYMIERELIDPEKMEHILATNDIFETKDGKKIALGVLEEHFWIGLCKGISREDLLQDNRFLTNELRKQNKEILHEILKEIFKTKTREEWLRLLKEQKAPASSVNNVEEAFSDQQLNYRGMIQKIFVSSLNKDILQVPYPVKLSETPAKIKSAPPELGEHTDMILRYILNYSEEKINKLKESCVF